MYEKNSQRNWQIRVLQRTDDLIENNSYVLCIIRTNQHHGTYRVTTM